MRPTPSDLAMVLVVIMVLLLAVACAPVNPWDRIPNDVGYVALEDRGGPLDKPRPIRACEF